MQIRYPSKTKAGIAFITRRRDRRRTGLHHALQDHGGTPGDGLGLVACGLLSHSAHAYSFGSPLHSSDRLNTPAVI